MATPRRSSQQQQPGAHLSSLPRRASIPVSPPGCPSAASENAASLLLRAGMGNVADGEVAPTSPNTTSPALALTRSSSSTASSPTTAEGSESSGGSTPDSGGRNRGSSTVSGDANGAFREVFEACRNGDVSRVKKLVDAVNVNAKDMAGRKSTPLHFAAGKITKPS
ncbi:hypothetical protein XENOCAPTIV_007649 [Xenoophorus captivus]|uniref:Uncharacterized protein n=1 Tax=Xenoophorus captivus TaxID=1517983 RepID=A0ABV0QZ30_9TELE